jgi:hypothetical protein
VIRVLRVWVAGHPSSGIPSQTRDLQSLRSTQGLILPSYLVPAGFNPAIDLRILLQEHSDNLGIACLCGVVERMLVLPKDTAAQSDAS